MFEKKFDNCGIWELICVEGEADWDKGDFWSKRIPNIVSNLWLVKESFLEEDGCRWWIGKHSENDSIPLAIYWNTCNSSACEWTIILLLQWSDVGSFCPCYKKVWESCFLERCIAISPTFQKFFNESLLMLIWLTSGIFLRLKKKSFHSSSFSKVYHPLKIQNKVSS